MKKNTFVCTTRNHYETTRMCLESLVSSLDFSEHELVIIDDSSTDRTHELSRSFPFITNVAGGLYRSWNIGIRQAETEFVTVINNDLLFPQRDWWKHIELALRTTDYQFVYPDDIESIPFDRQAYGIFGRALQSDLAIESGFGDIRACCFTARKSFFERFRYFDEDYSVWYGEKDFEAWMMHEGVSYGKVTSAAVRHLGNVTIEIEANEAETGNAGMDALARQDFEAFRNKMKSLNLSKLDVTEEWFSRLEFGAFSWKWGKPGADRSRSRLL